MNYLVGCRVSGILKIDEDIIVTGDYPHVSTQIDTCFTITDMLANA